MDKVKYRLNDPRLAPRRTRLEIPGWAGQREPRKDGSREQVWHCVPFSEGAQYGIELFYPYDNELHVTTKDGHLIMEADWGPPPAGGLQWPRIYKSHPTLSSGTEWTSSTDTVFDGTYRHLHRAAKEKGRQE